MVLRESKNWLPSFSTRYASLSLSDMYGLSVSLSYIILYKDYWFIRYEGEKCF